MTVLSNRRYKTETQDKEPNTTVVYSLGVLEVRV